MDDGNAPARWHRLSADEVLSRLETDRATGLDELEAAERLRSLGRNEIELEERRGLLAVIAGQLMDFMIVVLIVAAVVAGLLGELRDSVAILVIVVLNAVVGATQELRAQRAIAALRRLSAFEARVVRDGRTMHIPAVDLVAGDIVLLAAGEIVPADTRLLDTAGLSVDESTLTGESLAVAKDTCTLTADDLPLGDRRNMAYKSTAVTRGTARGVVVATGRRTEIGRIAHLLVHQEPHATPLQRRLAGFGRRLALAVLGICAVIFVLGMLDGREPLLMFLTAVSLAVAAIPEALPAVVTASLALGARKLSGESCLVRRLPAVESLGSVTFICADKTGTLTENRMRLESVHVQGGDPSEAAGGSPLGALPDPIRRALGTALALCNDVATTASRADDPTEVALLEAAKEAGFDPSSLVETLPRLATFAFDSERKRMTTVHREGGAAVAYTKGAPEAVLAVCTHALDAEGQDVALELEDVKAATETLAASGHRVLAVALRRLESPRAATGSDEVERDLTLIGVVGLSDPIRAEVPQAIADCLSAGIAPIMITGDHPDTARHIARELGLVTDDTTLMTGPELAALSEDELAARVRHVRVYARVDPEQKIRIVETLERSGEFVAMTGDGVNDAPALKRASIGVAMGQRGTDVAREAAEMVLLDDNFATIVAAIREGRRVYDNIRKFIRYTLTSNAGEIWVLLLAPFLGLPIPLLPIQILWVNLVTDGLPGLAFSAEPAEPGVMRRPPRPPRESVFARGLWQHIVWVGLVIAGVSLGTALVAPGAGVDYWQTMVFTTLVLAQLAQALAVRSESTSLWAIGVFSNPFLIIAVLATFVAQVAVIYLPLGNAVLHTTPLTPGDLAACVGLGVVVLPIVEIGKWLTRKVAAARSPRET